MPKKPNSKAKLPSNIPSRAFTSEIYGKKKSGRWGKLNAEERALWRLERGIYSRDDISGLPDAVINDFSKLVNAEKKRIAKQIAENPSYRSVKDAPESLTTRIKSNDPKTLFREYSRQQSFQRDFESDREYEELKKSHKVDYPELDRVLEEDDKWTILRRLAQVDPMLNIDRSYASQVLHDIERMIEQESKNGAVEKREAINKITAHYLNPNNSDTIDDDETDDETDDEEYTIGNMKVNVAIGKAKNELEKIKHMTDTWNAELQQLIPAHDYQSAALRNNKGFHGVDKALRKVEREIEEYAKEGE